MAATFITGIGTEVGETNASAIMTEALHSDYLKPIQAEYGKKMKGEGLNFRLKGNYCESILVNCTIV